MLVAGRAFSLLFHNFFILFFGTDRMSRFTSIFCGPLVPMFWTSGDPRLRASVACVQWIFSLRFIMMEVPPIHTKNFLFYFTFSKEMFYVLIICHCLGSSAAHKVNLRDASFPEDSFEIVQGFLDVTWQRIAPGSNVSHVVILRPLKAGYFNFTAAEVAYFPKEDATETQVSMMTLFAF